MPETFLKSSMSVAAKIAEAKARRALETELADLVAKAENRHLYLAGHLAGVSWIAAAVADEMGFTSKEIEGVRMAASVHDVGMAGIPTAILKIAENLTPQETQRIETHPTLGYEKLRILKSPWPLAEVALQHHERLDGSGYPNGLGGTDISQAARIVAVADVIEVITSHRGERGLASLGHALAYLQEQAGVLFDATAVRAAKTVLKDQGETP